MPLKKDRLSRLRSLSDGHHSDNEKEEKTSSRYKANRAALLRNLFGDTLGRGEEKAENVGKDNEDIVRTSKQSVSTSYLSHHRNDTSQTEEEEKNGEAVIETAASTLAK